VLARADRWHLRETRPGTTVALPTSLMRPALLALFTAACAAPPIGLGTSARIPTAKPGELEASASGAVGVGRDRYATQLEAAGTLVVTPWFSFEAGAAFTQQTQALAEGREQVATGGFPYLRPRITVAGVSIATALAGLGFGGGGGGFIGGIADLQVGYGTKTWAAYAGAYRQYFELVSEEPTESSSSQYRVGGEYSRKVGAARIGLALEVYRHHDRLHGDGLTTEQRFVGAGLKLRITSPAFR